MPGLGGRIPAETRVLGFTVAVKETSTSEPRLGPGESPLEMGGASAADSAPRVPGGRWRLDRTAQVGKGVVWDADGTQSDF